MSQETIFPAQMLSRSIPSATYSRRVRGVDIHR
jgi:hypothetical protein